MKERGAQDPSVPGMTQDLWSSFSPYPLPALARSCFSPASDEGGEAEESGDLLSAQKVPRGEILGSRRSQSCSGDRLSKGNDWTGPGRPTGWRTLVLLRSLPTIYSPPSPPIASHDSPFEISVLFRPNPFFRFPAPVCVNLASKKSREGGEKYPRYPVARFQCISEYSIIYYIFILNESYFIVKYIILYLLYFIYHLFICYFISFLKLSYNYHTIIYYYY